MITKCKDKHESHLVSVMGHCDICGHRSRDLRWCGMYKRKRKNSAMGLGSP